MVLGCITREHKVGNGFSFAGEKLDLGISWTIGPFEGANPWQVRCRYDLIFGLIEVAAQHRSHNIVLSNSHPTN